MAFSARLREALAWSHHDRIGVREIAIAALGMVVPAAIGLVTGRADLGFTIGLGAMLLAGQPSAPGQTEDPSSPGSAIAPAILAVVVAMALAPLAAGWVPMIAIAGTAALLCNYSRPLAIAAIRFIIYLVLSITLLDAAGPHRSETALVFALGAVWNIAIRRLLTQPTPAETPIGRAPTAAQRRIHFKRTMGTATGWQFPIRIALGLTIASLVRIAFPAHHFDWVVLTVALLTQRAIEHLPVKTVQRAVGTLLGVGLTWAIVVTIAGLIPLAVLICSLATGAGIARSRNYLAYSVLATPVILLILDLHKAVEPRLLVDRLLATLIGAAIVIIANLLFDRLIRTEQHTLAQASRR